MGKRGETRLENIPRKAKAGEHNLALLYIQERTRDCSSSIYLSRVNYGNTRTKCQICSKLITSMSLTSFWCWADFTHFSGVSIEPINAGWVITNKLSQKTFLSWTISFANNNTQLHEFLFAQQICLGEFKKQKHIDHIKFWIFIKF